MPRARLTSLAAAALLAAAGPAAAAPPPVEPHAVRRGSFTDDLYVAGRTVAVDAQVSGDVVTAGGEVTVGRSITGDVLAAGGRVTVGGDVADDVRAAGGELILGGRIGGDLVAAGGKVTVPPEARVAGRTRLAGGEVEVGGRHERGLQVYGGRVRLAGEVPGDVEVVADVLEVLPGARIGGTLAHATRNPPVIDPAAQIGRLETLEAGADWRADALSRLDEWRSYGEKARGLAGWAGVLAIWPALLVTGLMALALAPRSGLTAARTVATDPGKSLGLGFVILVVAPALAVVLLLTVVGVWLGLALLALYPVALLAGLLVGIGWLGDRLARAVRGPDPSRLAVAGGFTAALILVAVAGLVPFVGGWVAPLALVAGLGAMGVATWRTVTGSRPSAAPAS